jgi:hypothetical protein
MILHLFLPVFNCDSMNFFPYIYTYLHIHVIMETYIYVNMHINIYADALFQKKN